MAKPHKKEKPIELAPDAWERFERAVAVVARSPPQHRAAKGKKKLATKRQKLSRKK
jgi:hypothetical protein